MVAYDRISSSGWNNFMFYPMRLKGLKNWNWSWRIPKQNWRGDNIGKALESQAQNLKAFLDGNITKWREKKEAMEKENVALMISLQELQVNQQKGKEKEIHQQKQMEDLEVNWWCCKRRKPWLWMQLLWKSMVNQLLWCWKNNLRSIKKFNRRSISYWRPLPKSRWLNWKGIDL